MQDFLNFREKGAENNGYDENKNRMVVKALLFMEKKLDHVKKLLSLTTVDIQRQLWKDRSEI